MVNLLFWNLNNKDLSDLVATACHENAIDILIIAEYSGTISRLPLKLNTGHIQTYAEVLSNVARVKMFSRFPSNLFSILFENKHSMIHAFKHPIGSEVIIVSSHLPSKTNKDEDAQHASIVKLAFEIDVAERNRTHNRSLVIGDLNINPFEKGMTAADGFHAVMDRSVAERISRTYDDTKYNFFYNPMWGMHGDETPGPSGTYYYNGGYRCYFWNIFDQILIRPSLLPYFGKGAAKILTDIGNTTLLSNGRILASYSDHLPLMATIQIERC